MTEKTYKGYLIDLDGTLYRGNASIPHAKEFVQRLREKGLPFLFVTNNSTTPAEKVARKLRETFGIEAYAEEVYTSALATADYLEEQTAQTVHVLGEEGLKEALTQAGMELTLDHPDYVVVGLNREVTYQDFAEAVLAIQKGAEYILTNGDVNYPTEKGLLPGAGSLGALIETATKKKPIVIGKPETRMMEEALERLELSQSEVLMVGDNLETDIPFGQNSDVDTLMVLTGVSTRQEAERRAEQPTYIRNHLGEWEL